MVNKQPMEIVGWSKCFLETKTTVSSSTKIGIGYMGLKSMCFSCVCGLGEGVGRGGGGGWGSSTHP